MSSITSKIPAPLAGLGLGLASLGAAAGSLSPIVGNLIAGLAGVVLLICLCKVIFNVDAFKVDLDHPVFSSIIPTFTMGLMIVCTFIAKLDYTAGKTLWLTAIVLHIALLIRFLLITLKAQSFLNIVPSYFIPPVGLVVACVSGKGFNAPELCSAIFYFGSISCILLLPLILWRLSRGPLPEPKKATLAILAAPASLCLAGYLSLPETPPELFLILFIPLSMILTLSVYVLLFRLFKGPFNPGWSAFTFPLVISSVAMLKLSAFMTANGTRGDVVVHNLGLMELTIAAAVVLVVLSGYIRFSVNLKKRDVL